jgi:peptidyl-prolyl cis-trans isomerase A (cyclophilin A)
MQTCEEIIMRLRSISILAAGALMTTTPALAEQAGSQKAAAAKGTPYAHFTTSEGNITIKLFEKEAPKTVVNFIGLAEGTKEFTDPRTHEKVKKPYYNGTIFHRVIANFMIQGGDPLGQGTGGPGYTIVDEFDPKLRHDKAGILSMANIGQPNSGGGQFFITLAATPWLNDKHTIFGEVVEGMDVVKKIGGTQTSQGDRPVKPITLQSVTIERK